MEDYFNINGVEPVNGGGADPDSDRVYHYVPTPPAQPVVPTQQPHIADAQSQPAQQAIPPQNAYQHYNPVVAQANGAASVMQTPDAKPPKKKNTALIVIIIIVAVCVTVAFVGIFAAAARYAVGNKTESGSSNNIEEYQGEEDDVANVESSDEAAKTDEKGNLTAAGVAHENIDSCVGITVYSSQNNFSYFYGYGNDNSSDDGKIASGEGSGVVMAEKNGKTYIITCAHVIAGADSYKITFNNGEEADAEMVGYDTATDIGVLVVKKTGCKVAKFGDSSDIEVGEQCIAIGCPGGLEFMNSVTQGIVSALDRPVQSSIGYSNECIQVDAAINPGNSGGALFNMQGQVIGINSSKIASTEYEGMGFAVPSNTAINAANSIIKNGYVAGRAKLGISYNQLSAYRNASDILSALADKGYKDASGTIVIQEINSDSDLKNKDVRQYDMIVAVNGETMTSTDLLTTALNKSKPGDTIKLTIARIDNNSIKISEVTCKLVEDKQQH